MMWIISILIILFTICILTDTNVEKYRRTNVDMQLVETYKLGLPLWMILVIVLLGIIPWLNITLFVIFIIFYFISSLEENWGELDNEAIVFSLDGGNIITKCLLKIKKLLCWKV
jgi:hypothetical protein